MKKRVPLHQRVEVLFEDQDVIVIEKAAGVLTYPIEGRDEESAIRLVRLFWKIQKRQTEHLYLLHRIDKETSGLLVFAKTTLARNSLRQQFEEHSVIRGYLAVTQGIPARNSGHIETQLGRDYRGRRGVAPKGKRAVTKYEVVLVNRRKELALIRCYLHTGRTHQVRIHMAHLGTPVVGDPVYGTKGAPRMALHAEVLGFIHPRHRKPLLLRTSLPESLWSFLGPRGDCVYLQPGTFR